MVRPLKISFKRVKELLALFFENDDGDDEQHDNEDEENDENEIDEGEKDSNGGRNGQEDDEKVCYHGSETSFGWR